MTPQNFTPVVWESLSNCWFSYITNLAASIISNSTLFETCSSLEFQKLLRAAQCLIEDGGCTASRHECVKTARRNNRFSLCNSHHAHQTSSLQCLTRHVTSNSHMSCQGLWEKKKSACFIEDLYRPFLRPN